MLLTYGDLRFLSPLVCRYHTCEIAFDLQQHRKKKERNKMEKWCRWDGRRKKIWKSFKVTAQIQKIR